MNTNRTNTLFFTLILVLIFSNFSCSWFSTNDEDGVNDSIVEIIDQDVINQNTNVEYVAGDYEIPDELIYNDKSDDFLIDKIYPLGWSGDGKFAYVIEPADEGSGFYFFELVVFDLINNKVAWSWKLDETEEGDLASVWKDNYEEFKKSLNKYEIVQQNDFELEKGKTAFKGNSYQIVLDSKTETEPNYGFEVIKDFKISIVSPEIGTKEIYEHKVDEFSIVLGVFVPGYLLSPNSERIVVVFQMERLGYEGPPNVVFFELLGSDLLRGFTLADGS